VITSLHVSLQSLPVKEFQNQSTFGKIMGRIRCPVSLDSRGILIQDRFNITILCIDNQGSQYYLEAQYKTKSQKTVIRFKE